MMSYIETLSRAIVVFYEMMGIRYLSSSISSMAETLPQIPQFPLYNPSSLPYFFKYSPLNGLKSFAVPGTNKFLNPANQP